MKHDVFSRKKRSEVMSKIRGSGNKETELVLASLFRKNRIRGWRRTVKMLGRPDFVFSAIRLTVFVDGCFWHGCPKHYSTPKGNAKFWKSKLEQNRNRDRKVTRKLRRDGWRVIRIWEHQLQTPERFIVKIKTLL